jgi:hypothetical protein
MEAASLLYYNYINEKNFNEGHIKRVLSKKYIKAIDG